MTEIEAIKEFRENIELPFGNSISDEASEIAISVFEEIQQYRALGTVEEIKKKLKTELPYMSMAQTKFKKELNTYKAIGTPEELQAAREKQRKKKPILNKTMNIYFCPICERRVNHAHSMFCSGCGQAIDWSEENE